MKFNVREFVVFAVILFFGGLMGQYAIGYFGLSGTDMTTQAIIFIVPTLIIYLIWINFGKKATDAAT